MPIEIMTARMMQIKIIQKYRWRKAKSPKRYVEISMEEHENTKKTNDEDQDGEHQDDENRENLSEDDNNEDDCNQDDEHGDDDKQAA